MQATEWLLWCDGPSPGWQHKRRPRDDDATNDLWLMLGNETVRSRPLRREKGIPVLPQVHMPSPSKLADTSRSPAGKRTEAAVRPSTSPTPRRRLRASEEGNRSPSCGESLLMLGLTECCPPTARAWRFRTCRDYMYLCDPSPSYGVLIFFPPHLTSNSLHIFRPEGGYLVPILPPLAWRNNPSSRPLFFA